MNCFWCDSKLIWGGDQDTEDNPEFSVRTNLSCPKCFSEVTVLKKRDAYDWDTSHQYKQNWDS